MVHLGARSFEAGFKERDPARAELLLLAPEACNVVAGVSGVGFLHSSTLPGPSGDDKYVGYVFSTLLTFSGGYGSFRKWSHSAPQAMRPEGETDARRAE